MRCTLSRPAVGGLTATPCQVEDPGQRDDLHLEVGIGLADARADLGQHEIRRTVRRADADLPGHAARASGHFLGHALDRLLDPYRMAHQALPGVAQRIAGRGFGEKRRAKIGFQPGNAPPHRRRVDPQHPPRTREAFGARHRKEYPQIVPLSIHHSHPLHFCMTLLEYCPFYIDICKATLRANRKREDSP